MRLLSTLLLAFLACIAFINASAPNIEAHRGFKAGYIRSNETDLEAPMAGSFGVDVATLISVSTWQCIKSKGFSFAVVRAWRSTCACDPNVAKTIANARAAGISNIDVYFFPSFGCSLSAAQQIDKAVGCLSGVSYGTLWLDVETGAGWAGAAANHAWLVAAVKQAQARGVKLGIYSSKYQWSVVMGSYNDFSNIPIWYAHYDNSPSFSDFTSFAGWTRPAIKQYAGDVTLCGADVDKNWRP